jgi:hypothetical protein
VFEPSGNVTSLPMSAIATELGDCPAGTLGKLRNVPPPFPRK